MENATCHFVFYTGPRKGEAQVFETARISIGRAGNCDFRLEAFQLDQIGAHHAEVLLEEGGIYVIYDLGTKAGTWINGERVHERSTLMHEDYIRFGQDGPEIIFRIGRPLPGKQPLPQVFPVTAELEFFSGSDAGRIFPINAGIVSNIGRRAELEIPLDPRGDMIVSGNHCNIRYVNGHFVLTDTSRNGSYVNGDLLDQPMEILEGDVIMLGDGGPKARFHVDEAKRHYPNHRALSPVVKPEAQEKSAWKKAPEDVAATAGGIAAAGAAGMASTAAELEQTEPPADAAATMASAKPFSSGGPVNTEAEHGAEGETDDKAAKAGGATEDMFGTEPAEGVGNEADLDGIPGADNSGAEPVTDGSPVSGVEPKPARRRLTLPSSVPYPHQLKFKPGKKVIFAAIAVVVVIGLVAFFTSGDGGSDGVAERGEYAEAIETLTPVANDTGSFSVKIPEGWTTLNRENFVSAESRDKVIALDYVRDPKLSEANVREMLARNGAQVSQAETVETERGAVQIYRAQAGNVRRVAALHGAATAAPMMAMLETTGDALKKLDEEEINTLLVENIEATGPMAGAAPKSRVASATPRATAGAGLPRPSAAAPTPVSTTAPTTDATPASTPATNAPAPTNAADTATSPPGTLVESEALNLALYAPEGWTGKSEEADEMLFLADGEGLEVRIARDPGELDAELTFGAMAAEDWVEDGRQIRPHYQAGEFSRGGQNLLLVLIPESAGTTLVIYATAPENFTPEQRAGISQTIQQLVPPAG